MINEKTHTEGISTYTNAYTHTHIHTNKYTHVFSSVRKITYGAEPLDGGRVSPTVISYMKTG